MYARKLRYDENFITLRDRTGSSTARLANPIDSVPVASPARKLQRQLEVSIEDQGLENSTLRDEKYSSTTSLAIIASSSLVLWSGIISIAARVY